MVLSDDESYLIAGSINAELFKINATNGFLIQARWVSGYPTNLYRQSYLKNNTCLCLSEGGWYMYFNSTDMNYITSGLLSIYIVIADIFNSTRLALSLI